MQVEIGVAPAGVGQHAGVGSDQGIHPECGGLVHRALPARPALRLGVSVDGDIELATALTDQLQARLQLAFVQVEPGEMAGIGVIAKAYVDGVRALLQGSLEGGQTARRTDQMHESTPAPTAMRHSGAVGLPALIAVKLSVQRELEQNGAKTAKEAEFTKGK